MVSYLGVLKPEHIDTIRNLVPSIVDRAPSLELISLVSLLKKSDNIQVKTLNMPRVNEVGAITLRSVERNLQNEKKPIDLFHIP